MRDVLAVLVVGMLFHIIYVFSIFDIYFRTPLVHGMSPVPCQYTAPAKRLVLFVADGLRADRLFQETPVSDEEKRGQIPIVRAPYLKQIVQEQGTFGVSHTRVPTESRPGHVAIIAGFYEDVSAVTKGWKVNPVNFDSVFNQSRYTWSFGSPDILPMFKEGASDTSKIETFMYGSEEENFSGDGSRLDTWVFSEFEKFIANSTENHHLRHALMQDKVVFFFHLLGLDTNGHAHRPHSEEYLKNIRMVDSGIKNIVRIFQAFFRDNDTAYIFTSDHGMSDIGNHGDGNPDNTRTPLVAWGAGISKPSFRGYGHDELSFDWGIDNVNRNDVNQADIAVLMATLIDIPIPMNSVGVLPLEYLDISPKNKSVCLSANARQIMAQYVKKEELKKLHEPFFQEYEHLNSMKRHKIVSDIQTAIEQDQFHLANKLSYNLINLSQEGLKYFQTYDWLFLRSVVSFGYFGWMLFSFNFVLRKFVGFGNNDYRSKYVFGFVQPMQYVIFALALSLLSALIGLKKAPLIYWVYTVFPLYFWVQSLGNVNFIARFARKISCTNFMKVFVYCFSYLLGLEILVVSYFHREILSAIAWFFAVIWPLTLPSAFRYRNSALLIVWSILCLSTSLFLFLPVDSEQSSWWCNMGAICSCIVVVIVMFKYQSDEIHSRQMLFKLMAYLCTMILVCSFIVNHTDHILKLKMCLPQVNQILSWLIFSLSLIFPFYCSRFGVFDDYMLRLLSVFTSLVPCVLLLGVSFESLFFANFSALLFVWVLLERQLYQFSSNEVYGTYAAKIGYDLPYRSLRLEDIRVGFLFLFFINLAFFGLGNVASVASFRLNSVYRLVTVFSPYLMAFLLAVKVLLPFLQLSATFGVISAMLNLPPFSIFLLTLTTCDIITLNFFFLVKDSGSWLEIGTSISHFIISSAFEILSILLFALSTLLLNGVTYRHSLGSKKSY